MIPCWPSTSPRPLISRPFPMQVPPKHPEFSLSGSAPDDCLNTPARDPSGDDPYCCKLAPGALATEVVGELIEESEIFRAKESCHNANHNWLSANFSRFSRTFGIILPTNERRDRAHSLRMPADALASPPVTTPRDWWPAHSRRIGNPSYVAFKVSYVGPPIRPAAGMVQKAVRHRCAQHPTGRSGNGA